MLVEIVCVCGGGGGFKYITKSLKAHYACNYADNIEISVALSGAL